MGTPEEIFNGKEDSLRKSIICLINLARDESKDKSIILLCKEVGACAMEIRKVVQKCRRPYITHYRELDPKISDLERSLHRLEDVYVSINESKSTRKADQNIKAVLELRKRATELGKKFREWLLTSEKAYITVHDQSILTAMDPEDSDKEKYDMLQCKPWIIRQLLEARQQAVTAVVQARKVRDQYTKAHRYEENILKQQRHQELNLMNRELKRLQIENRKLKKLLSKKLNTDSVFRKFQERLETKQREIDELIKKNHELNIKNRSRNMKVKESKSLKSYHERQRLKLEEVLLDNNAEDKYASIIPYALGKYWIGEETKRIAISNICTDEKLEFINILQQNVMSSRDEESFTYAVMHMFRQRCLIIPLVKYLVKKEVELTKNPSTLFRSERLSSRILRVYTRLFGRAYAWITLGELLKEVKMKELCLEIDPIRCEDPSLLDKNVILLSEYTQRFLDRIIESVDYIPNKFLKVCKFLVDSVVSKFGKQNERLVISGFIFLRYFNPCITSPEKFGLIEIKNFETRRTLLLISKVIQNIANGIRFKEPYMQCMNPFLRKNESRVTDFFRKLKVYPPETNPQCVESLQITHLIYKYRDRIEHVIDGMNRHLEIKGQLIKDTLFHQRIHLDLSSMFHHLMSSLIGNHYDSKSEVSLSRFVEKMKKGDDCKLKSIRSFLLRNEEVVSGLVICAINESKRNLSKLDLVARSLVTVFHSVNDLGHLFRIIIKTENGLNYSNDQFMNCSMIRAVLLSFIKDYCSDFTKNTIGQLINQIIESNIHLEIESDKTNVEMNKTNVEMNKSFATLKKLSFDMFLPSIVESFRSMPESLCFFVLTLAHYTEMDVFEFMVMNYFSDLVEDGRQYGLIYDGVSFGVKRSLMLISKVLRNVACKSKYWIQDLVLDRREVDGYYTSIMNWIKNPIISNRMKATIPSWERQRSLIKDLLRWMFSQRSMILKQFHNIYSSTSLMLSFKLKELVDDIAPLEAPNFVSGPSTFLFQDDSGLSRKFHMIALARQGIGKKDLKRLKALSRKERKKEKKK